MNTSRLQFGDSSIDVHHQGAHLSSWVAQGKEQLFLSRKAIIQSAKAIRGGVPICFPQFGAFGPGQHHGFARNVLWQQCDSKQPNVMCFELSHDQDTLALWPHKFKARFDLELNKNSLNMSLHVENVGSKSMAFTAALHTYFSVEAVESVAIGGLQHCEFWDNGTEFERRQHQQQKELRIRDMIDRVYFNTSESLSLAEPNSTRLIQSQGFADTVVWNPWSKGAKAFADMAGDEYQQMLCVESANVQTPVCLQVGEVWRGVQKITVDEA